MQKVWTTRKYKKWNYRRSQNRFHLNLKRLALKKMNRLRFIPAGFTYKSFQSYEQTISKYERQRAPSKFSIIENTNNSIQFINGIEKAYLANKKIFINLRHVIDIDYPAIAVLLSVMFTVKSKGLEFNGNFPIDRDMTEKIKSSDFFKHLSKKIDDKDEYKIGKKSQIFTQAHRQVNAELCKSIMEDVSKFIWGERRMLKGLTRVLIELMHNTNNHASVNEKGIEHWWLSVNYELSTNIVKFVFVDYGVGIFESLKNKPKGSKWTAAWNSFITPLLPNGKHNVLKSILEGEMHESVTGLRYRGKGLPGIKEVMVRNQISQLYFITNDVFADVSNDLYKKLDIDFCGTLAYWEINANNINSEWTIK